MNINGMKYLKNSFYSTTAGGGREVRQIREESVMRAKQNTHLMQNFMLN